MLRILLEGARLQSSLELSGRSLALAGSTLLTSTLTPGAVPPDVDLIVLAEYAMIDEQTELLRQLGFRRVEVMPTVESSLTTTITTTEPALVAPTPTAPSTSPSEEESSDEANGGSAQ